MNFFDEGSPYLGHPLLTADRTRAELDRIDALVGGLAPGSSVLDLGCGFGRHCNALVARGHVAVGFDPSATMIAAAATTAEALQQRGSVSFHQGVAADAGSLVAPASIDLALCLFTTFGQRSAEASTDASTTQLLDTVATALKPGGMLVIELPERDRAVAMLVAEEKLGPTTVTRRYDAEASVMHERFRTPDNVFDLSYELFDSPTLQSLIGAAGLEVVEVLDTALVPPPPTFMTMVARR